MVNVVPLPTMLSTAISPLCSFTIRSTMASPRPDPPRFRSIKGFEDIFKSFRPYPRARILDGQLHLGARGLGGDRYGVARARRIESVDEKVQKRLLHTRKIAGERRNVFIRQEDDLDVPVRCLLPDKLDRGFHDHVDVAGLQLDRGGLREPRKLEVISFSRMTSSSIMERNSVRISP